MTPSTAPSTTTPTLYTPRLRLRAHTAADFEPLAAMWADPEVTRLIGGAPSTTKISWQRLMGYAGHWALLGYGYWAIERRADGAYLGEAGFADLKREFDPPQPDTTGEPEAGWVLRTDAHGQGYATEALTRMLEWAQAETDWASSYCIISPDHTASLRLADKLGYRTFAAVDYFGPVTLLRRPFARPAAPYTPPR